MSFPLSSHAAVSTRVALEPVYNVLNTFSLLTSAEHGVGLNTWVIQTATTLSPERHHANRLVFEGLRDALAIEQDSLDFATYLHTLAQQDPCTIRARVLERLRSRFSYRVPSESSSAAPDRARLLSDVQAYLICVESVQLDTPFDSVLSTEVHALLNDLPALHHLLVSHLEALWAIFASEWRRVQAALRWQVEMFTRSLDEEASIDETFRTFTGRELPAHIAGRLSDAPEILLVPSWHTGRRVTLWDNEANLLLFFSEPPNYDVAVMHAAPVGRAELRARFDALADETRLRILELLVQQDELSAQEIIAALNLSQSSVSRHLKQLISMKYLYERRGTGANKTYRLSSFYFERTARALEQLVSGEGIPTERQIEPQDATQPQELRRFLDRSGRLTFWPPSKQRDKLLILEYLASFFKQGQTYTEKEVNEVLLLHTTFKDSAALRRALYEYRFMNRTHDGSRYWLIGAEPSEEEATTIV